MSADDNLDTKVSTAQRLYAALAAGDRQALSTLLHPDFVGHATEGLPLGMGGRHDGPEAMRRDLWWTIGRHYKVEAQPEDFRLLDDSRLSVAGHYRGEGRKSGRRLDAAFIHLIAFADDGRIVSLDDRVLGHRCGGHRVPEPAGRPQRHRHAGGRGNPRGGPAHRHR